MLWRRKNYAGLYQQRIKYDKKNYYVLEEPDKFTERKDPQSYYAKKVTEREEKNSSNEEETNKEEESSIEVRRSSKKKSRVEEPGPSRFAPQKVRTPGSYFDQTSSGSESFSSGTHIVSKSSKSKRKENPAKKKRKDDEKKRQKQAVSASQHDITERLFSKPKKIQNKKGKRQRQRQSSSSDFDADSNDTSYFI